MNEKDGLSKYKLDMDTEYTELGNSYLELDPLESQNQSLLSKSTWSCSKKNKSSIQTSKTMDTQVPEWYNQKILTEAIKIHIPAISNPVA